MLAGSLLAPYAWGLYWLVLLGLPTTSLGGDRAWLLRGSAGLAALLAWSWAALALARVTSALARNLTFAVLLLGWALLPLGVLLLHTTVGTPQLHAADCAGLSAIDPVRCHGRDHSFMHGRERYVRIEGHPSGTLCTQLSSARGRPASVGRCDVNDAARFEAARCERFGVRTDWRCYTCQEQDGNGAFSYVVYGFDRVCRQGLALLSTNVIPERVQAVIEGAP